MSDTGEFGLHTNWENCEGGLCCDEALAIMETLVAERDEAVEMSRQMVAAYELAGEETEAAEVEVKRLREAADAAMHELGVPQDHLTPAPVGNAYEILRAALSPKEDE